ncbi:hypothetical protein QE152_g5605 [Popillia japonica]|uniref:Secreted protein n=1 Tax=Popillia japonica TaxID=7064 RepID=A0AAW1MIA1_POPJA
MLKAFALIMLSRFQTAYVAFPLKMSGSQYPSELPFRQRYYISSTYYEAPITHFPDFYGPPPRSTPRMISSFWEIEMLMIAVLGTSRKCNWSPEYSSSSHYILILLPSIQRYVYVNVDC